MSLFNGLRPFGVKKNRGLASASTMGRLRRVRLFDKVERTRRLRPLGLAPPIRGQPAGLLQMRLHRRGEALVDAEVLSETVDLVHELLARIVVINLVGAGDGLIAVEPVERLEIGRDRGNLARRNGFGGELNRWSEAVQLQLRMLGPAVDPALLQLLRNDLPDA